MAFATGTVVGQNNLLAALRTFLVAQGWTSLQYTAGATVTDIATAVLRAPGASVGNEFYLYLATANNPGASAYGIEIRAATGYDAALLTTSQNMISPAVFLNLWQNSMTYWFYGNGRHVKIVAKVNTSYMSAYAGLFLPYALPTEYPRPFFIGASYPTLAVHSFANTRNRFFCDPGDGCAYLYTRGAVWVNVANHADNTTAISPNVLYPVVIWPYRSLVTSNSAPALIANAAAWSANGLLALRPNLSGNMPMFLCQIVGREEKVMQGALEGVFALPGFGRTSEQLLTFGGRNFRAFQNAFRTTARDYMALEEI